MQSCRGTITETPKFIEDMTSLLLCYAIFSTFHPINKSNRQCVSMLPYKTRLGSERKPGVDVGFRTRHWGSQVFGDPDAADLVFTCGAKIRVIGLNVTHQITLTGQPD